MMQILCQLNEELTISMNVKIYAVTTTRFTVMITSRNKNNC